MARMNKRIISTHDIEANWQTIKTFIPERGEIIIFDSDENVNYSRIKVGDGSTSIMNLPFVADNILAELINFEEDIGYIDSGRISEY